MEHSERFAAKEWRWCLVGNIVDKHEWGEAHEIKYGTKHFSGGTKVYILPVFAGSGHEHVLVIGLPRHYHGYIEVALPKRYVENFRLQKVFCPSVLKRMEKSNYDWWGNTDADREAIIKDFLKWWAPEEAEKEKTKTLEGTSRTGG